MKSLTLQAVEYWQERKTITALQAAEKFGVSMSDFWAEYNASLNIN